MNDTEKLQQERIQLYHDLYENRIPKRVPVQLNVALEALAQFGKVDIVSAQWDGSILEDALDTLCQTIYSDICPGGNSSRHPSYYDMLGSRSFLMGSNGFMQHPEIHGMEPEDYDYLIEKPYDCLLERVIPKQHPSLNAKDPMSVAITLAKSILAFNDEFGAGGKLKAKYIKKYGYYPGPPPGTGGLSAAPFDFIADQLRGFTGISMDIRRIPEKVGEACEAVYPLMLKRGVSGVVSDYGRVGMPLHMPTFMRERDFAKYWWPTFKQLLDEYASHGIRVQLFCEDNWMRYLDYLYDLPVDTEMRFEYGDPQIIKDKLGEKYILTGLYPMTYLQGHTKQQCIDKAKEYIDILAPGGKYYFCFDKAAVSINEIDMNNFAAVSNFVKEYAVYPNAGETAGMQFRKEDYNVLPARKFESKYYHTWEEFKELLPRVSEKGEHKIQAYEDRLFSYLTHLLF